MVSVSTLFDNAELILPQADEVLHLCEDFHTMFWSPVTHQQTLTSFLSLVNTYEYTCAYIFNNLYIFISYFLSF